MLNGLAVRTHIYLDEPAIVFTVVVLHVCGAVTTLKNEGPAPPLVQPAGIPPTVVLSKFSLKTVPETGSTLSETVDPAHIGEDEGVTEKEGVTFTLTVVTALAVHVVVASVYA